MSEPKITTVVVNGDSVPFKIVGNTVVVENYVDDHGYATAKVLGQVHTLDPAQINNQDSD